VSTPRRQTRASGLSVREAAELVGGRLEGPDGVRVTDLAPIAQARPDELAFLSRRRYLSYASTCRADALLLSEALAEARELSEGPATRIVVEDPYRALVTLLERLHPPDPPPEGVHPTAVVERGAEWGEGVWIGPYAVVESEARIGDGCRIGPHTVVGRRSRIGARSVLHPHVVLYPNTVLGEEVVLHAGVKVGVDGFGYVVLGDEPRKVPQVGSCVIEDGVEIGANCAVDRGSIGRTVVGRGSKLDNLVHVGHNVEIGAHALLAAQVGLAGSTRIGEGIQCGGQSGIGEHLEIGEGVRLAARAGAVRDVEEGATVAGFPARDLRSFLRARARLRRLPEMEERIRELERSVARLSESPSSDAELG